DVPAHCSILATRDRALSTSVYLPATELRSSAPPAALSPALAGRASRGQRRRGGGNLGRARGALWVGLPPGAQLGLRRPRPCLSGIPGGGVAARPAALEQDAGADEPEGGHDLERRAADGKEDEHGGEDSQEPHPARDQAHADGIEHHRDHARCQREASEQSEVLADDVAGALRERIFDGLAGVILADREIVRVDRADDLVSEADERERDAAGE